jgi:hypothetical protein
VRHKLISGPEAKDSILRDSQCTYNVILRRVRATIVAVEKQRVLHSLNVYVAFGFQNAMGMRHYCHPLPATLYNIFPHYLTNGKIFLKKVTKHSKCVLIFSTTFVRNSSHSKKK